MGNTRHYGLIVSISECSRFCTVQSLLSERVELVFAENGGHGWENVGPWIIWDLQITKNRFGTEMGLAARLTLGHINFAAYRSYLDKKM